MSGPAGPLGLSRVSAFLFELEDPELAGGPSAELGSADCHGFAISRSSEKHSEAFAIHIALEVRTELLPIRTIEAKHPNETIAPPRTQRG